MHGHFWIYGLKTSEKVDGILFPSVYDKALVEAAERLGEVDGQKEISSTRTDLRHLPLSP